MLIALLVNFVSSVFCHKKMKVARESQRKSTKSRKMKSTATYWSFRPLTYQQHTRQNLPPLYPSCLRNWPHRRTCQNWVRSCCWWAQGTNTPTRVQPPRRTFNALKGTPTANASNRRKASVPWSIWGRCAILSDSGHLGLPGGTWTGHSMGSRWGRYRGGSASLA